MRLADKQTEEKPSVAHVGRDRASRDRDTVQTEETKVPRVGSARAAKAEKTGSSKLILGNKRETNDQGRK